jgi:prolyl-tRNA editing enzyme YbaK/EbsC (Cys-tRNA(Pro) deacylase)
MERTILELERIWINGGKRGYLVGLAPQDVVQTLKPTLVAIGIRENHD